MTDETKTEMTQEQAKQTIDQLKGSLAGLAKATSDIERELTAADRHDAREDQKLALYKRDTETAIEARDKELANVWAHRQQMEEIERENVKSMASIAESLKVIAKTILEEARS